MPGGPLPVHGPGVGDRCSTSLKLQSPAARRCGAFQGNGAVETGVHVDGGGRAGVGPGSASRPHQQAPESVH